MLEFLAHQNCGEAVSIAHNLWRCVKLRSWDENGGCTSLRQVEGIDMQIATSLEYMGVRTLRQLAGARPGNLTRFVHQDIQLCSNIINRAASIADFFAVVSTLEEIMRVVVKTKPSSTCSPSADESQFKQTCTLLVWVPDKILLYREAVESEATFDVQLTRSVRENNRFVYVRLFHDQFAGMDERFEVDLHEEAHTNLAARSTANGAGAELRPSDQVVRSRTLLNQGSCGETNDGKPPSSIQDSKLLREIKKLERHHKTAKQQSIFQYLRHTPESESPTPAIHQDRQHSDNFQLQNKTARDEAPRQLNYVAIPNPHANIRTKAQTHKREARPTSENDLLAKIPDKVVHAVSSDDDNVYCSGVGVAKKRDTSIRDILTKRKAADNLFAHFRFTKRSTTESDQAMKLKTTAQGLADKAKPGKVKKNTSGFTASRSAVQYPTRFAGFKATKARSKSTKIKTANESAALNPLEVTSCPIRSTPFFKSFVREKVRGAATIICLDCVLRSNC